MASDNLLDNPKAPAGLSWAAPERRLSTTRMAEGADWARRALLVAPAEKGPHGSLESDWARFPAHKLAPRRIITWYFECNLMGSDALEKTVEIDPKKYGGVPVLKGTRFTVSQALAELALSSGIDEVADNYDLDPQQIKDMLEGISLVLMKPFAK